MKPASPGNASTIPLRSKYTISLLLLSSLFFLAIKYATTPNIMVRRGMSKYDDTKCSATGFI